MSTEADSPCGSALSEGLGQLVERLRFAYRTSHGAPSLLTEAADEIERLLAHIERVEAWQRQGDALMDGKTPGAMFSLGSWWADRPWRERA